MPINEKQLMTDLMRHLRSARGARRAHHARHHQSHAAQLAALRAARVKIVGRRDVRRAQHDNRKAIEHYGNSAVIGAFRASKNQSQHIARGISQHISTRPPSAHERNICTSGIPFTQEALDPAAAFAITRAEGVYLYTADGRRLIDGISSWWVNLHGHGHPAIVAAIAEQARKLDHVLLAGFTHDASRRTCATAAQTCCRRASITFSFPTTARRPWKWRSKWPCSIGRISASREKNRIVALEHAYHGDTAGAMSVGADSSFTDAFSDCAFRSTAFHAAYCYRCPVGKTRATCDIDCLRKTRAPARGRSTARSPRSSSSRCCRAPAA